MIFMVKNSDSVCYDPEFDMWFSNHPYASDYIFSPLKWIKTRLKHGN